MKTLAEKISDLKVKEDKLWERYYNAVCKEANALLKRFGEAEVEKFDIFEEYDKQVLNADKVWRIPAVALAVTTAKRIAYIERYAQEWLKVSAELYRVKSALEDK